MDFLRNLFGKKQPSDTASELGNKNQSMEQKVQVLLSAHLKRLDSAYRGRPHAEGLQQLCKQLSTGEQWLFAVSTIEQQSPHVLSEKEISNATKLTASWFIAVTICPWLTANEVRTQLPGGYLTFLNNLVSPAFIHPEGRHIAHWIWCSDGKESGVHLTLIPNAKVIRTVAVMAEELLTPSERRQAGL